MEVKKTAHNSYNGFEQLTEWKVGFVFGKSENRLNLVPNCLYRWNVM
ncbi:hypothetical protein CLU83_0576 [Flavobacterium sp. 1]|nr:hypothetical protein [Flavobacterium sp. 1]PJJ07407.1 hypothetical protein CLU83_0576 [Flavobacterium sp. 1]